jgi:predicted nucleic acid-binding protein
MIYTVDSSSIFEAISKRKVDKLVGSYTTPLAEFELGNIVWKKLAQGDLTEKEAQSLIEVVEDTLDLMEKPSLNCREGKILSLGKKLELTYWDASYVLLAREMGTPLVTEDKRLARKAAKVVDVLRISDL